MANVKEKLVDLHMHSNISDGLLSPGALMKMVSKKGLHAAGLTDHDSIEGLGEAESVARKVGIEFVPGVEISVLEENQEVHLLGYYPRYRDHLQKSLIKVQAERLDRMANIIKKLNELGFKVTTEEVIVEAGNAAPGRMHLARLLLKKKYVHTLDEAFTLYLAKNKQAYVPRETMSLEEAMKLLRDVEAVRILAHPGFNDQSIINKLMPLGLQGLEVFHPDHSPSQVMYFKKLTKKFDLIRTGGSDYHGDSSRDAGYPLNMVISMQYLESLKYMSIKNQSKVN